MIVTSFMPYYEATHDWTALAWWIHDHIEAYANMTFYPKFAAFNITWSENPQYHKSINSFAINPRTGKKGILTKFGMENFSGSHEEFYRKYLNAIADSVY